MPHYKASAKELAQGTRTPEGTLIMPDGRELCLTDAAYSQRTYELAKRQNWRCAICTRTMLPPTFDHESPRGMGGSSQDDGLLHADGTFKNAALCLRCNIAKGSARYHWTNGNTEYVPRKEL